MADDANGNNNGTSWGRYIGGAIIIVGALALFCAGLPYMMGWPPFTDTKVAKGTPPAEEQADANPVTGQPVPNKDGTPAATAPDAGPITVTVKGQPSDEFSDCGRVSEPVVIGENAYSVHHCNNLMHYFEVKWDGQGLIDLETGKRVPSHCSAPLAGQDTSKRFLRHPRGGGCPPHTFAVINIGGTHHSAQPSDLLTVNQVDVDPETSMRVAAEAKREAAQAKREIAKVKETIGMK